jgi:hypothetical protein
MWCTTITETIAESTEQTSHCSSLYPIHDSRLQSPRQAPCNNQIFGFLHLPIDPVLKTNPHTAHISQPVNLLSLSQSANPVPLLSLPLDSLLLQFTDQLYNRPDKLKHNLMRSSWCTPNTENSFRIQKATVHCSSLYPFMIQNPSLQDDHTATRTSTFFSCPYSKSRNKSTDKSHLNWSSSSLFLHCLKSINQSSSSHFFHCHWIHFHCN